MKKLSVTTKIGVALTLLITATNGVMAGTPIPPNPPASAPIDAGAIVLLVVGAIIGIEKLYRSNKLKNSVVPA